MQLVSKHEKKIYSRLMLVIRNVQYVSYAFLILLYVNTGSNQGVDITVIMCNAINIYHCDICDMTLLSYKVLAHLEVVSAVI